MSPIRLGLIGCGLAARNLHRPAINKLKETFNIVIVDARIEVKAKISAEMAGWVDYVLDYRELLARDDVKAVDTVLPIPLNYSATRASLQAGKHVLAEKPLSANLSQAKKMLSFPLIYPRVMGIAENYRYRPLYRRVKTLLENGFIATPYSAVWNVYYHVFPETNPYARTEWRIQHRYPGGFILDDGGHNIADFRTFFGEIYSGTVQVLSLNPGIGRIDIFQFQWFTEMRVTGTPHLVHPAQGFSENRRIGFGAQDTMVVLEDRIRVKSAGKSDHEEIMEDDGIGSRSI